MRMLIAIIVATLCWAQQQLPAFDVASVKQVREFQPGTASEKIVAQPGSLMMRDVRLRALIMWAYDVKDFQISGPAWLGAPGWGGADVSRFEIIAKAPQETPIPQMRLMLQQLLADRFRLILHREQKEASLISLTAPKGASKLKRSVDQEQEMRPTMSGGSMTLFNSTMADLAQILSGPLRLPVVDQTGLPGRYDLTINVPLSPDPNEQYSFLVTALHDLGFELKQGRDKIEFLVVDSAERKPSEN